MSSTNSTADAGFLRFNRYIAFRFQFPRRDKIEQTLK